MIADWCTCYCYYLHFAVSDKLFGCWRHKGVSFKTTPTTCISICMLYICTGCAIFYVGILQKPSSEASNQSNKSMLTQRYKISHSLYPFICSERWQHPLGSCQRVNVCLSLRSFHSRSPSCCCNRQHFSCSNCLLFGCEQYK